MMLTKLLLLIDELSPGKKLEHALTHLGYDVQSVMYTGNDCLYATSAFHVDLALIDTQLAGKLDGLGEGRLKLPTQKVPILYFVSSPDSETIEQAKADLPLGFITINLPPEVLKAAIELALEKYQDDLQREESEEKFRMIFENAPLMIDSFDEQGRCVLWNQACLQILGWSQEEVNAHENPFQLFYPNPQEHQAMQDNFRKADGKFREYRVQTRDHSLHTQLWADFRLPNGPIISIGHDITERKKTEEELRNYRDHLEEIVMDRTLALTQLNEQLQSEISERKRAEEAEREQRALAEVLRDTAAVLNSTLDMDEVLDFILANVGRVVAHDAGYILLLDEACINASVIRHHGFGEHDEELLRSLEFSIQDTHDLASMVAHRKPFCIEDVSEDPDWVFVDGMEWVRSTAGAPVLFGEEVTGLLILLSSTSHFFCTEHAERLQTFANQASIAIQNARMYEQARDLATWEERQRLAREMHDSVSQTLFSASLKAESLQRLWEGDPEVIRQGLYELHRLTRGALAEMRTLLVELRPQALVNADLGDLVRQLADGVAGRSSIEVLLNCEGRYHLPVDVQTAFFRIAQESLNNVIKHARASRVEITLFNQKERVQFLTKDNGCGFDPEQLPCDRLGIKIMNERAAAIGAELLMSSCPGQGTVIRVEWYNPHG
jgi:PAS domain S-box-containing protein